MATASKTWTWDSTLESYVATADGDGNAQRDGTNGSPNAGSLQMYLTPGRTQTGNGYFDLTTVSWATLFGISSSATVTDVQVLAGTRTYAGLTHWLAVTSWGVYIYVYVSQGGDQLIWSRSGSAQDSSWNTGSAATKYTLPTPVAASTNADLRLRLYATTGNTANSTCSVHLDYLTIEITYGTYGTANVAACAVASATPTKVPGPKQGTANVACCVYTGQGTLGSQEFVSDVTADGEIYMTASTIAAVRDGTGSATATATGLEVGLRYVAGPIYRMGESFIGFNTGGTVPDDGAVLAATLSLYCTSNQTATDSIFEVYAYDWSPTVETADYRTATQILALTKLAIFNTAGLTVSAYNTFSSLTALLAAVSTTGYTYLIVVSDHFATNQTTPTGLEYGLFSDAEVTNQQPKLYVEWLTVVGPTGTKPSGSTKDGTANVVCCAVTAAGSTKPARTSPVVATVASATASRTRARTVEAVAVAVASAAGRATKSGSASAVSVAVASATGSNTTVPAWTLTDRGQPVYSDLTPGGKAEFSGVTEQGIITFSGGGGGGGTTKQGTASIVSVAVASVGSVKPAHVAPVACAVVSEAHARIRSRTVPDCVVAVEATATGEKAGGAKNGTANVSVVVVASEAHARIRNRTASTVAVATATAGSVKPARSSVVTCAVATEAHLRVRARTASVVGVVVAAAGATKPARSTPVVATVATANGQRIRSRTASLVACAVASAYAAEIEANTAAIVVATVATANGTRVRLATSAPVAVAVASAASVKPARSSIVCCAVATATGSKGGYKYATAEVVAVVVASAASVKPARSSVVSACVATATGAAFKLATASVVCCAAATAAGKNICAVTFTEPHDDDRYEYATGGQIAWTCTPVSGVTFHLYAVYRGTAVQYWLKDVAADGSGSYSTADDFNIPPGQYRMTVVVT